MVQNEQNCVVDEQRKKSVFEESVANSALKSKKHYRMSHKNAAKSKEGSMPTGPRHSTGTPGNRPAPNFERKVSQKRQGELEF